MQPNCGNGRGQCSTPRQVRQEGRIAAGRTGLSRVDSARRLPKRRCIRGPGSVRRIKSTDHRQNTHWDNASRGRSTGPRMLTPSGFATLGAGCRARQGTSDCRFHPGTPAASAAVVESAAGTRLQASAPVRAETCPCPLSREARPSAATAIVGSASPTPPITVGPSAVAMMALAQRSRCPRGRRLVRYGEDR